MFLIGVFPWSMIRKSCAFTHGRAACSFFFMVFKTTCWSVAYLPAAQVPAMAEIMGVLLKVGLSVGWLLMAVMGIVSVFQKDPSRFRFYGESAAFSTQKKQGWSIQPS